MGKNLIATMFKNVKKQDKNLFAFMGGAAESKAVAEEEDRHEGKSIAIVTDLGDSVGLSVSVSDVIIGRGRERRAVRRDRSRLK